MVMITKTRTMRRKGKPAKTIGLLKKKAWSLLSQCVRLEYAKDGYVNCYTCGKHMHWKEAQAGHAIGGRTNAVLLDEEILRPQCVGCNVFKRGEYQVFVTKLIEENGFDWWKQKLEASKETKKYLRSEIEEIIVGFKQRLKELEHA